MPGLPQSLAQPRILLCEGREDVRFFRALANHLGITDLDALATEGKTKYRDVLSALVRHPDYPHLTSLGIMRDADDNPSGTFRSICHALQSNGLLVPSQPGAIVAGQPRVGVMILPDNASTGMLEDLCLLSIQADPAYPCLDMFFQCVANSSQRLPQPPAKARTHAWLATQPNPEKRLGEAAESGYWPWDDSAFDAIKQFLRML